MLRSTFFVALILVSRLCEGAPIAPSSTDLWDYTQGNVAYHTFYWNETDSLGWFVGGNDASRARNMFGASLGNPVLGADTVSDTVFPSLWLAQDQALPAGTLHYIDWDMSQPTKLNHFNLFARHNEFADLNRFTSVRLLAKELNSNNFVTLYELDDVPYPYASATGEGVTADPSYKQNELRLSVDVTPFTTTRYRLELVQATDSSFPVGSGPIIEELDGFGSFFQQSPADLNQDEIVDAKDIDLLFTKLGHTNAAEYDLDGNGLVDYQDASYLITNVLGTKPGDANLDGHIELSDFGVLKQNFGKAGVGWAGGDFNGAGGVDLLDFGLLKQNFGFARAAAVPEPPTLVFAILALLLVLPLRRR